MTPTNRDPVVALATYERAPHLPRDEAPLPSALAAYGVRALPVVWTDDQVDWTAFAGCVVRATWDYHFQRDAFLAWARRVANVCALWNPLPILEWNSHKSYLHTLARSGVPVVPTVLLREGERSELADVLAGRVWDEFIVKPTVGADAWRVVRGNRGSIADAQAHVDRILVDGDVIVQPYFPSVEEVGERSLIFVDGELTHAVRRPAALASEPEAETLLEPELVSEDERRVARVALHAIGQPVLYARVDLVHDERGAARLLELELIEPALFFALAPHAVSRLARAIADRILTR
jgi:hypothetical protein